jgi:hypothetical protein
MTQLSPDLVAQVFALELKAMNHDLFKEGIIGRCIARVQVIKFQKQGLPHTHTLLILDANDRPRTAKDVNR